MYSFVALQTVKQWLKDKNDSVGFDHDTLRVETQNLHEIKADCEGTLLWMPGVAQLRGVETIILAIVNPGDQNIRWFYVRPSVSDLVDWDIC
jgi:hypothetical protein